MNHGIAGAGGAIGGGGATHYALASVPGHLVVKPETSERVWLFFKLRDGFSRHGYQLPFIARECGLPVLETMAAICVLMEARLVEAGVGPLGHRWRFWKAGAR